MTRSPLGGVLTVCIIFVVWLTVVADANARDAERERARADSLAIEAVAERARAAGWEARFGEATEDLTAQVRERDDMLADLGGELEAARARVAVLTRVAAVAAGRVVDTVVVEVPGEVMIDADGGASGTVSDDILSGVWAWSPPVFSLDYRVSIPGEIVTVQAGDDRTLVLARSLSPLARIVIDSVWVDPVVTTQSGGRSIWWKLPAAALLGYLVGR